VLVGISLYLLPLLVGLVYWLAFFPGVLTYDSVSQWDQLSKLQINDWHPAIHTILMWLLTRLWYSPAVVSLFQVLFASLILGYGLNSLHKASQLPSLLFIVLGTMISATPLVGVVNVTLWKDVIYGFLVLLLTVIIFNIVASSGNWITRPVNYVVFGGTLALICLFRYNGFPVAIASLVFLFILFRGHIRQLAYSTLIALGIVVLVLGPLYSAFKVDRSVRQSYGFPLINPVVAYVSANKDLGSLSQAEQHYLDLIYPLDKPWTYSCYDATVFFYQDTNLYPVIQQPFTMVRIFSKLAEADPAIAIKHFLCQSSFVWQPNQPRGVYLETILFDSYDLNLTPAWTKYQGVVTQRPLLPQIHQLVERLVKAEWYRDIYMLLWRPALYMYAFLAGLILLSVRTRRSMWLLLAVPMVSQSIVIMLTTQLQALRYQYPVYLISMLFTIPLIIVAIKNPDNLSFHSQSLSQ
jgi:hypothetical protein